jgi:hypothetical protein
MPPSTDMDPEQEAVFARMLAAVDPGEVIVELAAIPLDQPLAGRLLAAAETLDAHRNRVRDRIIAISDQILGPDDTRALAGVVELRPAVTRLLEPESLRVPPDALARAFLRLLETPLTPAQAVDLFLHGVI